MGAQIHGGQIDYTTEIGHRAWRGCVHGAVRKRGAASGEDYRVGHLSGSGAVPSKLFLDAFREGMRALGYVEAKNFVLEERYAEGKGERLPTLAAELIQTNPDVLFVATTPGNLAAKADYKYPYRYGAGRGPGGRGHRQKPGQAGR